MAESCQAYKCTYGSRIEYLCTFIIIFFFIHQVSSLLATLPLRRNSRKELHFWWKLIRQAFTWNSSRLLRVPGLGWWWYNLLRGTNCSNFCSGTEGELRAQGSVSQSLYFAQQNRRDSYKQTPKRQKVNHSTKAFQSFWQILKPGVIVSCSALWRKVSIHTHMRKPENYNTDREAYFCENNSPCCDYCFDGEYTSDTFCWILSIFFALPVPFFFIFITMWVHTQTQLAVGGKVVKRVWVR